MRKSERVKFRFRLHTTHSLSKYTKNRKEEKISRADAIFWKIAIIMTIGTRLLPTYRTALKLQAKKNRKQNKIDAKKSVNSNICQLIQTMMLHHFRSDRKRSLPNNDQLMGVQIEMAFYLLAKFISHLLVWREREIRSKMPLANSEFVSFNILFSCRRKRGNIGTMLFEALNKHTQTHSQIAVD